jgi:hypothetical protein
MANPPLSDDCKWPSPRLVQKRWARSQCAVEAENTFDGCMFREPHEGQPQAVLPLLADGNTQDENMQETEDFTHLVYRGWSF